MIPLDVLDAFWLSHEATPLLWGQGSSWRVGNYVLKPHESAYVGISEMVAQLKPTNFRVSYHHKTLLWDYTYKGWGCTKFEKGEEVTGRITEKYRIAQSLHDLFADIEIPLNWKPSDSPWSRAHEIVWWERNLPENIHPEILETIKEVVEKLRPIRVDESWEDWGNGQKRASQGKNFWDEGNLLICKWPRWESELTKSGEVFPRFYKNQIIHSDLCGNILFHETLSPVVIDFSLDYRPREYAEAILIADSIAWENGWEEAYNLLPPNSEQILLRACLFRLVTKALLKPQDCESFAERSAGYQGILREIWLL